MWFRRDRRYHRHYYHCVCVGQSEHTDARAITFAYDDRLSSLSSENDDAYPSVSIATQLRIAVISRS
jgi:hypothetical protein